MTKQLTQDTISAWTEQFIESARIEELDLSDLDTMATEDPERLCQAVDPYDDTLAVGQIRLLTPSSVSNPDHLPYVAILARLDETHWLVAPFSRFTIPATSGEMLTGDDFAPNSVLQAWNAYTVSDLLLRRSWLSGNLDSRVIADAHDLYRHCADSTPLPETFRSVIGPALDSVFDLRHTYLQEEREQHSLLVNQTAFIDATQHLSAPVQTRQAAAGENFLSNLFCLSQDNDLVFLAAAENDSFDTIEQGNPIPQLCWTVDIPQDFADAPLLFRHRQTNAILGVGHVRRDDGQSFLLLEESLAPNGSPLDILAPEDIQIFVRK